MPGRGHAAWRISLPRRHTVQSHKARLEAAWLCGAHKQYSL